MPSRDRSRAFSLLELLATIAIIAILAALLLPVLEGARGKARRVACGSNLKQVGVASHAWARDHDDAFPMQVPMNRGGTFEIADRTRSNRDVSLTFRHFQALSNELISAKVLVCPADRERVAVNDFSSLRNENVSYWINPAARFGHPDSPLAGDRNIRTSGRTEWAFLETGASDALQFSAALHGYRGNLLFGDAHVADLDNVSLRNAFTPSGGVAVVISLPQRDVHAGVPAPNRPEGNANAISSASDSRPANAAPPSSPSAPRTDNRSRAATAFEADGSSIVFTRLDGSFATSSVPPRATNSSSQESFVESSEAEGANPWMEFMTWLTRKAAGGTYWLLFLLLLALASFEIARRRARRPRPRPEG